jgi:hypothetical protein
MSDPKYDGYTVLELMLDPENDGKLGMTPDPECSN